MVPKMYHNPKTKTPADKIAQAVRRYMAGEAVETLAKEYRVSTAGVYLWLKKAKEEAARNKRLAEIGPKGVAKEDSISKELRLRQLEQENDKLKKALFDLMVKHGEI